MKGETSLVLYRIVLFLHVLSVIVSLGPFFIQYPLLRKMRDASADRLEAYLNGFASAVWLSKHGGHVLVTTGVILVWAGSWAWLDFWLMATVIVMFASLLFMARAFSPTIRKLRAPHEDRSVLIGKLTRNLHIYVALMLIMLFLMVTKPMPG